MKIFSKIWQECLDFLFPKTQSVTNLESIPSGKLLQVLSPAEPSTDENIILLFDYKDPLVREMIWELKYKGNRVMADKLGEIVFDVLAHELAERAFFGRFSEPLLMPMPISDKRRNERGWNQTELVCEGVMKNDSQKLLRYKPRQLVKHRHTESQTKTASRKERMENIMDSMRVLSPNVVEGKFIVLIDDVYTTGSTFHEAKRALRKAGAKKILFLGLAH